MKNIDISLFLKKVRDAALIKAKDGKWIQDVSKSMKKKGTVGSFTEWCGGRVTNDCIERGLRSKDEKIRKRAQLAKTFREMRKKEKGGSVETDINTTSYIEDIKNNFLSKINTNVANNILFNIAEKAMDIEDSYIDLANAKERIKTLTEEFYGGMVKFDDGGNIYDKLSYEEYVDFIMQYPEYFKRFLTKINEDYGK